MCSCYKCGSYNSVDVVTGLCDDCISDYNIDVLNKCPKGVIDVHCCKVCGKVSNKSKLIEGECSNCSKVLKEYEEAFLCYSC